MNNPGVVIMVALLALGLAWAANNWGGQGFPGAPAWFTGNAYGESSGRGGYQGRERYRYDPGRGLWRDDGYDYRRY